MKHNMTDTTKVNFTVYVDITTSPATYTYTDAQGVSCDGSVTVTADNTQIVYTMGTSGLIFLPPTITGDTGKDLQPSITADKQCLTIVDSDIDNENACLILVVAEASAPTVPYPSPDPMIRNVPR
jgi:hypothetical protein